LGSPPFPFKVQAGQSVGETPTGSLEYKVNGWEGGGRGIIERGGMTGRLGSSRGAFLEDLGKQAPAMGGDSVGFVKAKFYDCQGITQG